MKILLLILVRTMKLLLYVRQRLDSIETETKKRELNENFSTTRLNER